MKSPFPQLLFCLFLALIAASPADLWAQNEVRLRLNPVETEVSAGQEFTAVVHADVSEGWHLYAITKYPEGSIAPQPTRIAVVENPVFQGAGAVRQPKPNVSYDENFAIDTYYFEGRVDFEVPVRVRDEASAGEYQLPIDVRFMACNDRVCLPPRTVNLTASLTIVPSAATPSEPSAKAEPALKSENRSSPGSAAPELPSGAETGQQRLSPPEAEAGQLPSGIWAYVWVAMTMGGLALLTPCVFPMIPITVSYFTKRPVSRRRAVGEAGLYSLGIILTFTLLGFLLTFLFGVGGINRVATSPIVNLIIASIFVAFALSLFGVFEIRIPSSWLTALDKKSSSMGGPVGILLMALTFSLTSFTCTVPFVGTVMVAATQGDWLWSLLGITVFASVFSAPFFLLALFPSWLKSLPKSGGWMNSVKITMGFLELAAAMKFISNVDLVYQWELITRPVFVTVWLAIALMTAIYLLGKFYFPHETPLPNVGAGRVLFATFFFAVSFYLLRGLFGLPLGELDAFLPPADYGAVGSLSLLSSDAQGESQRERWLTSYPEALQVARAENRSVFIDFTGYTCTNCRWMEANIFVRPQVQELFSKLVLVRLYTDGGKPQHEENLRFEKERFGTIALPLYALMTPDDQIIATFPGLTRDEAEFVAFLEKGIAPKREVLAKGIVN